MGRRGFRRQRSRTSGVDRLSILSGVLFLFAGVVVIQLFRVQILQHTVYHALAKDQRSLAQQTEPRRGEIYAQSTADGEMYPVAINQDLTLVYAIPKSVEDPLATAEALLPLFEKAEQQLIYTATGEVLDVTASADTDDAAIDDENAEDLINEEEERVGTTAIFTSTSASVAIDELGTPEETQEGAEPDVDRLTELVRRLSKVDDVYEPLEHYVPDDIVEEIRALELPGIAFSKETVRYYPERGLFSHVTGFVGFVDEERRGQYGLEGFFEDELSGAPGSIAAERDINNSIASETPGLHPTIDGTDLVLTIEFPVQFFACEQLQQAVAKHGADRGTVIVLEPDTGAVRALCNTPTFDPNEYSTVTDQRVFANDAIFDQYEPGSVFKGISMAAALDLGLVTPETTYEDTGSLKFGRFTIRNSDGKTYGIQSMTNVLEESLNTGAIFVVQKVGNGRFNQFVQRFGFGAPTGIGLSGETSGDISSLALEKDLYAATGSYGQGITVTPLQLITAYGAIANGGRLLRPYIVEKVMYPDGSEYETEPALVRQVLRPETSRTLSAMLVNVVQSGHAGRAGVAGYHVAGKTGTAQVPRQDGAGYQEGKHKDTFVGFGPVIDPQFVVLAKIDNPRDVQWAAGSAAPLTGRILDFLFEYYQVPPETSS